MIYKLKQARKMKGESLREAAKGLKLSHEGLRKYENGLIKMGSKELIKFAKYYGVTVDYLVPSDNKPKIELTNVQFHKLKHF